MMDGSVRPLTDSIDRQIYRGLGSRGGGEVIGDFDRTPRKSTVVVRHRYKPDFAIAIRARGAGGPPLPKCAASGDRRVATTIEAAEPLTLLAEPLQDLFDLLDDQLQRLVGHLEVRMRANVGVDLVK